MEFEALEFEAFGSYSSLWCFDLQTWERFALHGPLGGRQWDIAAELGGRNSRHVTVPVGDPLRVEAHCFALSGTTGPLHNLGAIINTHRDTEWGPDSPITVFSEGGDPAPGFRATYRICRGTCDSAVLAQPELSLLDTALGGHKVLSVTWRWGLEDIEGFRIYMDGGRIYFITPPAMWQTYDVQDREPGCGGSHSFYVTAYGPGLESPPSNTVSWESAPCEDTVEVTFRSLEVREGFVRRGQSYSGPGVEGRFWAPGNDGMHELNFKCSGDECRLEVGHNYLIQGIFQDIIDGMQWCPPSRLGCPPREAPGANSIHVALGPDDELTFGAEIRDQYGELCRAEGHIPAILWTTDPPDMLIGDREIELSVEVDLVGGP